MQDCLRNDAPHALLAMLHDGLQRWPSAAQEVWEARLCERLLAMGAGGARLARAHARSAAAAVELFCADDADAQRAIEDYVLGIQDLDLVPMIRCI